MNPKYLAGVTRMPSIFNGVEIIGSGPDTWYAGNYRTVTSYGFIPVKKAIIATVNRVTLRNTEESNWQWHHVVETEHLSYLMTASELHNEKFGAMPCILIHQPEHVYLSRNFNNNEFRELTEIGKGIHIHAGPFSASGNHAAEEKKRRTQKLQDMYTQLYSNYPTLKKISNNVFAALKQHN